MTENLFDALTKTSQEHGLVMDFAMGPNQGQGVPAHPDDDGLQWDLYAYNTTVPIGESYDGKLPGWGTTGKLQAVVTGLAVKSENLTITESQFGRSTQVNITQTTLATDSLQDVTKLAKSDGTIKLDFTGFKDGVFHQVFAFYLVRSLYRNEAYPPSLLGPQTVPKDFVHNGSWTVDHFSSRGAKVMTDFWENYLVSGGEKELLGQVGNYAWEDSIEM